MPQVKIDEVLCFVCHVAPEVSPDNYVPNKREQTKMDSINTLSKKEKSKMAIFISRVHEVNTPCWIVLLIKLLFNISRDILFEKKKRT